MQKYFSGIRACPAGIEIAILLLVSLFCTRIPLFNKLGFEFSATIGFVIGIITPRLIIRRLRQTTQSFWFFFLHSLGLIWFLLLIPLVIILINAINIKNCHILGGFKFYLLIPYIAGIYIVSLSIFWGYIFQKRALFACYGHLLLSILLGFHNIIFHPPVFIYHSLIGLFPGPIYDTRISIDRVFIYSRMITLIFTVTMLWGAYILSHTGRRAGTDQDSDPGFISGNAQPVFQHGKWKLSIMVVLSCLTIYIWFNLDSWEIRPTRSSIQKTLGGRYETDHFIIYHDMSSGIIDQIELIASDHEFRYLQLSKFFKLESYRKIGSYIYKSPDQKKRLMGARHTSICDPFGYEMHLNFRQFPHGVLKHEMAHIFAASLDPFFKVSLMAGLTEGIAEAADWQGNRLTPHQSSKAMHELGRVAEIQKILSAWGFWTGSGARNYNLTGSFVRFLVERYGMDKFKTAFPTGNFEKAYNKSLGTLAKEWETFLEAVPLEPQALIPAEHRFSQPGIFIRPCPHEVSALKDNAYAYFLRNDYFKALELFQHVYEWVPDNPNHLKPILETYIAMENPDEASNVAHEIINHPSASRYLIAEVRQKLGNIYWDQNRLDEAEKIFTSIYELHLSNHIDRSMAVNLHAIRSSCRDIYREVLLNRQIMDGMTKKRLRNYHEAVKILRLKEILVHTGDPVASYLIGRRLFNNRDYTRALRYLQMFVDEATVAGVYNYINGSGSPAESLNKIPPAHMNPVLYGETHHLMGIICYHLERYNEAIEHFIQYSRSGRSQSEILQAVDWIERCEWQGKIGLVSFPDNP